MNKMIYIINSSNMKFKWMNEITYTSCGVTDSFIKAVKMVKKIIDESKSGKSNIILNKSGLYQNKKAFNKIINMSQFSGVPIAEWEITDLNEKTQGFYDGNKKVSITAYKIK